IIILATDLPLSSRQLGRLARRVPAGLGRVGSIISHGSGDFVLAFSTAHRRSRAPGDICYEERKLFREDHLSIDKIFQAVVEATEEAVINSLFLATTVTGRDNHRREALPPDEVLGILARYGVED
ncbi:MAG: P1 family peptidase, partial [Halanaerobium sp.]|nr:P1 family peptidase [Halanaerobium sp.]